MTTTCLLSPLSSPLYLLSSLLSFHSLSLSYLSTIYITYSDLKFPSTPLLSSLSSFPCFPFNPLLSLYPFSFLLSIPSLPPLSSLSNRSTPHLYLLSLSKSYLFPTSLPHPFHSSYSHSPYFYPLASLSLIYHLY